MDVPTRHHGADVHGEVDVTHAGRAARVNDGVANLRALLFVQRNVCSSASTLIRCGALHRRPCAALQSLELLLAPRTGAAALGALLLLGALAALGLGCLLLGGTLGLVLGLRPCRDRLFSVFGLSRAV